MGLRDVLQANSKSARTALQHNFRLFGSFIRVVLVQGALSFKGPNDAYYSQLFGPQIMQMIFQARKSIYTADLIKY